MVHHPLLSLKRHLLIRFDLLYDTIELAIDIFPEVILILLPVFCFSFKLFLKTLDHMSIAVVVTLDFFDFESLHPLTVLLRVVKDSKVLVSVFFDLRHEVTFDVLDNGLNTLSLL